MGTMEKENFKRQVEGEVSRLSTLIVSKVYDLMDAKKMKQADLARKLGVSRSHVTQVLDGERNMTLQTMAQLAIALDTHWTIQPMSETARTSLLGTSVIYYGVPGLATIPGVCEGLVSYALLRERSREKHEPPVGSPVLEESVNAPGNGGYALAG